MKMCEAFSENRHEVTLLFQNKEKTFNERAIHAFYDTHGFTITPIPIKKETLGFHRYLSRVYQTLKKENTNLVYGRFLHGCLIATFLDIPTVYESHMPAWRKGFFEKILFNLLLARKSLKYIVVISEALKTMYVDYGIPAENILVAHDAAVPVPNFENRANLDGRAGAIQVGFVGNLYEGKGMEIIAQIAPALPEVDFHIIGGQEKDISRWQKSIASNNVFFHGFIPQEKLLSYRNALDICLLPIQETVRPLGSDTINIADVNSPLKLFDYMAHGKAIIASDLPVIREVLNEQNAILVPPHDTDAWIRAIQKLIENTRMRSKLGAQALEDFMNHYTWQKRATHVLIPLS